MNKTKDSIIQAQDEAIYSPVNIGVAWTISRDVFDDTSWPIAQAIDPICNSIYQTVDEALLRLYPSSE